MKKLNDSKALVTVRAQPPSIPLMEAVSARNSKYESSKELPPPPSLSNSSAIVFPGTRSETPPNKPTAKFLITPNSTRSPVPDKEQSENGVRLVKSYTQLRRRSSSTGSPTLADEGAEGDSHHHRAVLLKNISAKDASATADYAGWLKKRTERGTSIAGLSVGPGAGVVGGWKKRWFVLKGRRLSYYHSDKVQIFLCCLTCRMRRRKGLLTSRLINVLQHRTVRIHQTLQQINPQLVLLGKSVSPAVANSSSKSYLLLREHQEPLLLHLKRSIFLALKMRLISEDGWKPLSKPTLD